MPRQLWLADAARDAGLTVHEATGWRTRGRTSLTPRWLIVHHTASRRGSGDKAALSICIHGRRDLPGPLCHYHLARSGEVTVVAAGRANHAGYAVHPDGTRGNNWSLGVEAENDGVGEPWPARQVDAYVRLCAAICRHMGWDASRVRSHAEVDTRGKVDPRGPGFPPMTEFRRRVAALMTHQPDLEEDDMARLVQDDQGRIYAVGGVSRAYINDPATIDWLLQNGHAAGGVQRIPTSVLRDAYPIEATDPQATTH